MSWVNDIEWMWSAGSAIVMTIGMIISLWMSRRRLGLVPTEIDLSTHGKIWRAAVLSVHILTTAIMGAAAFFLLGLTTAGLVLGGYALFSLFGMTDDQIFVVEWWTFGVFSIVGIFYVDARSRRRVQKMIHNEAS